MSWAGVAVFIVMALWFVWALDVQNGYHTLLHLGGISLAVLVGARVVSIVVFGALARIFHAAGRRGQVRSFISTRTAITRCCAAWSPGSSAS